MNTETTTEFVPTTTNLTPQIPTPGQPVPFTLSPPSVASFHPACSRDVEPWPEPVAGAALLDALTQLLRRFVVLPDCAAEALALWIVHTYAFELGDISTYVGIESPEKRCGKTTLLSVLSELVNRPVVAANISSPAFFRVIEETRPTLLIDEADILLRGNDELRGILNSGYSRKTAYVVRVSNQPSENVGQASRLPLASTPHPTESGLATDEENVDSSPSPRDEGVGRGASPSSDSSFFTPNSSLARFSCWCPKAIAAIGRLPDTLADRCIVIRMQRKTPREACERLRNLDASSLRRQCARFVLDHAERISSARPELPASLNDRASDIWEPLLTLADLAGGDWPARARQASVRLSVSAQEINPMSSLLLDIRIAFTLEEDDRIFSRRLIEYLNRLVDRPWEEFRRGRAVTELWLAQQLRPYGIRPSAFWREGIHARGYEKKDFREIFQRYIPRSELEALLAGRPPSDPKPQPN